jgi:peroxiredoxin
MRRHAASTSALRARAPRLTFVGVAFIVPAFAMAAGLSAPAAGEDASPQGGSKAVMKAEIGKPAPDFALKDLEGKEHRLSDETKAGHMVVLEWFNPDCPFIQKHHLRNKTMVELAAELQKKGVVWFAINSGAPGKQGAGLERNRKAKTDYEIDYPILLDESGVVGRMYGAKTTPDMFVISPQGVLLYAGAIDDDPSPRTLGKTNYVRQAIAQFEAGEKVSPSETVSYGCSVKYAGP